MANEISTSKVLSANKGGMQITKSHSAQVTMAGDDMLQGTQLIGTTWEAIDLDEISGVPAEVQVSNLDGTNYVQLATANDDSGIFAKLLAGRSAQWPPNAATIYAKANTAACRVAVVAMEA